LHKSTCSNTMKELCLSMISMEVAIAELGQVVERRLAGEGGDRHR
jgi:hypothetical protein